MRTSILVAAVAALAACAAPAREAPPAVMPVMPAPPVDIALEVVGTPLAEGVPVTGGCAERAQPPEVKLAVGHYHSHAHGIGLVIDRTEEHAKIRFDHAAHAERLVPRYSWFRTEYHRPGGDKVLEVRNDGAVVVYLAGQEIWVHRDCDADPL